MRASPIRESGIPEFDDDPVIRAAKEPGADAAALVAAARRCAEFRDLYQSRILAVLGELAEYCCAEAIRDQHRIAAEQALSRARWPQRLAS